jgi:hypothetical protein
LPVHRAARRLELVLQFLVFAPQPLPLGLRSPEVLFELRDPARLVLNDLLRVSRRRGLFALRHAAVMPNPDSKYKQKMPGRTH